MFLRKHIQKNFLFSLKVQGNFRTRKTFFNLNFKCNRISTHYICKSSQHTNFESNQVSLNPHFSLKFSKFLLRKFFVMIFFLLHKENFTIEDFSLTLLPSSFSHRKIHKKLFQQLKIHFELKFSINLQVLIKYFVIFLSFML